MPSWKQPCPALGFQYGNSVAVEEFIEGHEGFYDTVSIGGNVGLEFISHYYPNVLEAMRTRWISPIFITTNRIDDSPGYDEVKEMGKRVISLLGIETSATHMEWFFGPKGSEVLGDRLPATGSRSVGPLLRGQRPRSLSGVGQRDLLRPA